MAGQTKVQPFFLTAADEKLFAQALKKEFPALKIVNDNRWPSAKPVLAESIELCSGAYVFLWPSDIFSELPSVRRGDQFEGPQSGVVMQMMRSKVVGDCLLSGQLGVGYMDEDAGMKKWSREVFNALRRLNSTGLRVVPNGSITGTYVVGPNAAQMLRDGGVLKHCLGNESYGIA